jgi:hypothetical protein
MRALLMLSLKDNRLLTKEGGKALAQALAGNSTLKELDLSNNNWEEEDYMSDCKEWKGDGPTFAHELAVGIKDNKTMTSLNLASNGLGAEGAQIVAEAIKVTKCTPAIILASFSINCCCLLLSAGYEGIIVTECKLQPDWGSGSTRRLGDRLEQGGPTGLQATRRGMDY